MSRELITKIYEEKFDLLVKRYTHMCQGSVMDGEDITQEAFARAYSYSNSCPEDREEAEKWLSRIGHHCFIQNRKEQKQAGCVNYDEVEEHELAIEEDKRLDEVRGLVKHLDKVLKKYPEKEREGMRLHFTKHYRLMDLVRVYGFGKSYWNKVSKEVYEALVAIHKRDAYYSKGGWVNEA